MTSPARPLLSFVLLLALVPTVGACKKKKVKHVEEEVAPAVEAQDDALSPTSPAAALAHAQELLRQGDDKRAMSVLDIAIAGLPDGDDKTKLSCELARVLNNRAAGFADKDPQGADVESARAVTLCPAEPAYRQNRARMLATRAAREPMDSAETRRKRKALLVESAKLEENGAVLAALGEILFVEDDIAGAVEHYERAAKATPNDEKIRARLEELRKKNAVEGAFKSTDNSHFRARFEGYAQEKLAYTALSALEKAYFAIGKKTNLYPADAVTVVIYTGDQYARATTTPDWSTGVFDGKIRIREGDLAAEQGTLERVLRHEYTHACLFNAVKASLPPWFHEGLAEHFEGADVAQAHALLEARAKEQKPLPTLAELKQPFLGLDADKAAAAYATAQVLVRALIDKRGEYALQSMFDRINAQGQSWEDGFAATYATTPDAFVTSTLSSLAP